MYIIVFACGNPFIKIPLLLAIIITFAFMVKFAQEWQW